MILESPAAARSVPPGEKETERTGLARPGRLEREDREREALTDLVKSGKGDLYHY